MSKEIKILISYVKLGLVACIAIAAFIGLLHIASKIEWPKNFSSSSNATELIDFQKIDWRQLRELNVNSGEAPDSLKALDGKRVQIPGFIVPLEDDQEKITEFLLVPSPQACIHVPPPPANQMIYVKMREPISFEWGFRAYWIQGILSLTTVQSPYGNVSFEMLGVKVKPYNFRGENTK